MRPAVTAGADLKLFVVHAPEDAWFVDGFLLDALRLPEAEVLVSSKLEPGAVIVKEIERGALSPVTVVVVSPAFLASTWAQFANDLATHQSVEMANHRSAALVPAILADCALPLLSQLRTPLDFRDQAPAHWEAEATKLRKRLAAPTPVSVPIPCPYPGIRPFTAEDAARFHGRDKEVTDLLGRLREGQRELYVIGPSGSGKSSLVVAGLVPSLRQSPELAGGTFLVRQMRPGIDPTAALAGALAATAVERNAAAMQWLGDAVDRLLANHPGHDRLLILIDQLEELFTTTKMRECAAFIDAIRELRHDARVALVLTLRADFYASLIESALWADLDGQLSRLDVSPLRGNKLRMAIEAPARALGVYFEPVLVERLLRDVADAPGALPLLQDTLLDLWHQRTRSLLRLAEYEEMGDGVRTGLAVTMARRADGALKSLSPHRQEIARRVLLRLVQFGDGTATTRRQQPRPALATASDAPEDIDAVVRHLADRRLVTTSGGGDVDSSARIDLAHEVLLSAWPSLGEWIRSRKEIEQRRRVLEAKAAEWVKAGRSQSRLLDAGELHEVRSWLDDDTARDLGVSEEIESLLSSSDAALAAQVAEVDNRHRRWRRWVTFAVVALTGAVVAIFMIAKYLTREQMIQDNTGTVDLAIIPFDRVGVPAGIEAVRRLSLTLYGAKTDDLDQPGEPLSTNPAQVFDSQDIAIFRMQRIRAPGGTVFLRIDGRGDTPKRCGPSWIRIQAFPGYHTDDVKLITLWAPTCEATLGDTATIEQGPFVYGGAGDPRSANYGSSDYTEQEQIRELDGFAIDRMEVSNAAYEPFAQLERITGYRRSIYPPLTGKYIHQADPRYPVTNINAFEAQAFCAYMGKRLPSEAQWVKAARGGTQVAGQPNPAPGRLYPWGTTWRRECVNLEGADDGFDWIAPVDSFSCGQSPYGVLNLVGNVNEWIARDGQSDRDNPLWALRGGAADSPLQREQTTTIYRNHRDPRVGYYTFGLRCVVDLVP